MKFVGSVLVTNGGTNPDPIASPGAVPDANLVGHDGHGPLRDRSTTQRLLLGFESDGGSGTTTVQLYALDDATNPDGGAAADRRFYEISAPIVLTHQVLAEVTGAIPARGPFYLRQTAGSQDGTVRLSVQAG